MESWAESMGTEVQFLCVCVESLGVAQMFDRMFRFEHAINCYIPSRDYFPRGYGQLGCSGFVVADPQGQFLSRKTRAYLQYGDAAFRHVESILAPYLQERASDSIENRRKRKTEEEQKESDIRKAKCYLPASVGVKSMDDEHESCANVIKTLAEQPTEANLRHVLSELENHFLHEEELMIQYGFGKPREDGSFSALDSHIQDHVRILGIARKELHRIQAIREATEATLTACASASAS
jgi:hemerythrin